MFPTPDFLRVDVGNKMSRLAMLFCLWCYRLSTSDMLTSEIRSQGWKCYFVYGRADLRLSTLEDRKVEITLFKFESCSLSREIRFNPLGIHFNPLIGFLGQLFEV